MKTHKGYYFFAVIAGLLVGTLSACGGPEEFCDPQLALAVSTTEAPLGQEIHVVAIGTNSSCRSIGEGAAVHLFVNGYGLSFPNDRESIDVYFTDTSASTFLLSTTNSSWGMLNATAEIDGFLVEAAPIQIGDML